MPDPFVSPYLTETELSARGAVYQKPDKLWTTFAVEDERAITGQNPASGWAVADLVIAALRQIETTHQN